MLKILPIIPSYTSQKIYLLLFYAHLDSRELQGQEEAGRTQRTSELFTGSTTLKFTKALNKLP